MNLTLVQLPTFVQRCRELKLTDRDLAALESLLMENPEGGKLIRGTGGLRKIRFAPPSWNRGKSGATRVIYAVFAHAATVYLFTVYAKGSKDTLTKAEEEQYRKACEAIRRFLER